MNIDKEIEQLKKRLDELERRALEQLPDNGLIYVAPKHSQGELIGYTVQLRRDSSEGSFIHLAHISISVYGSEELARGTAVKVFNAISKFIESV